MGELLDQTTGRRFRLGYRQVLGRAVGVDIRMNSPGVSAEHASLYWDGLRWVVRDLGSSNGTQVDRVVVRPGEDKPLLPGSVMALGSDSIALRLCDASSPRPSATRLGRSGRAELGHGLLELAGSDGVAVAGLVFCDGEGRWVLETGPETRFVEAGAVVDVDGVAWKLDLPGPCVRTAEVDDVGGPEPTLALEFRVSQDEEYIEITAHAGSETHHLGYRAHNELLLLLARKRLEDAAVDDLAASAHGWLYVDEIEHMLRCDNYKINMDVFRARRQMASLGLAGAPELVERRVATRQLRLGVVALRIETV